MPTVWFTLLKTLQCKSGPSEVYEPKAKGHHHLSTILTSSRKGGRSGCSRSIANLKDVIHGSQRHLERPPSCSPRSIGSSEFQNPIAHEVIFSNSNKCELKITGFGGCHDGEGGGGGFRSTTSVGTLKPGTPGPGGGHHGWQYNPSFRCPSSSSSPRRVSSSFGEREGSSLSSAVFGNGGVSSTPRPFHEYGSYRSSSPVVCPKCGEEFLKMELLEEHHLSKHAVTELIEGDSSRKIVEIICRTSWLRTENSRGKIERILKIHNTQKTLARFEDHREMVKLKASKLPKKHPRCIADGNELLRFHGTSMACSLGISGSSNLCFSEKCSVCRIIRHGFSAKKEMKGGVGVFTTSTSVRAYETIEAFEENASFKKALLVCRVIAGRVHKPLENFKEFGGQSQSGFDSLAGKVGLYSNIEELYLLNPRALLPCFVVIYKP